MLEVVTSANIACGFHAGDPATIDRTVRTAVERGVAVGAQVSYPDLVGFGRRELDVPPDELTADVLYQLGALEAFARAAGSRVRYVKPHGSRRSEEHTSELQSHSDLHSFPTRRSSDLARRADRRRPVPARRPRGLRQGRRQPGPLREAARLA